VRVVSAPPTQVSVSNWPAQDPSGEHVAEATWKLVDATWWLGLATVLATAVALLIAVSQGRETKRRDRDTMMRNVSRAANRVLVMTTRTRLLAESAPARCEAMYKRAGRIVPDKLRLLVANTLKGRLLQMEPMFVEARDLVGDGTGVVPLSKLDDAALTVHLWSLDKWLIHLEDIRFQVDTEIRTFQQKVEVVPGGIFRAPEAE